MIKGIVLTAERLEYLPVDYQDMSTDVIVDFDNGDKYIATFFSHKSLATMFDADTQADDFSAERYYRVLNAVLVKDFNNGNLLPVIEDMIAEGDFQLIFRKIN